MIIGLDFFESDSFKGKVYHSNYNKMEVYKGVVDQIYIDEEISIPYTTEKPTEWRYGTVLNAKFQNSLEGGSVEANNMLIEKIMFQRRKWDELEWEDVTEVRYERDDKLFYEAIDKFVSNKEIYQYCIVPVTSTITGNRVVSSEVMADFEGVFISDKDSNYKMIYNIELDQIENNISNSVFEPQNSKYPIVVTSSLDYATFGVSALFVSTETMNSNEVDIRMERLGKNKLMAFLKNGKPKVYRDSHGVLKLVMVVGNPTETPNNSKSGLASISVNFVEIGDMDSETLKANNLQVSLSDVY